jgi:hypothetical protein
MVIDDIAFQPDLERLQKKLHVKKSSAYVEGLKRLVQEAQAIARPRAVYRVAYVDSRSDGSVVIDGITFNSRVLRVNLENAHRVFPFVATCGTELYEWMNRQDDILLRYFADTIGEMALRTASAALKKHLIERYRLGRTATMSPGSLPDWPLQAQQPLFALLGDTEEAIGVRLTDSLWMIPSKSVSGMRFPIEQTFESCQLCPRERCPSRIAPYDEELYDKRYRCQEFYITEFTPVMGVHTGPGAIGLAFCARQ